MINHDQELKLQAYLDNELSAKEAREVAAWLEREPQARSVQAELTDLKALLAGNELEIKLPESREFYWSKIQRAIRQDSVGQAPAPRRIGLRWWWRFLAPAAGLAALLLAALPFLRSSPVGYLSEIETPLEETSAISFHSQSAGMTVVWVQNRDF